MLLIFYLIWACNLLLCWVLLTMHIRLRSPHMFFWIGILSLFILPSVADPFTPIFKGHPLSIWFENNIETLIQAQVIVFVSLSAFYFLQKIFPISPPPKIKFSKEKKIELFFPVLLIALTFIPVFQLIQSFGPLFFITFSFADRRESLTYLGQILLSYNVICTTGLAYWAYSKNKKLLSGFTIGYFLVLFFFLGGSRQSIIAASLPFFAFYIFETRHKFLKLGTLIIATQIVVAIFAGLLVLRNEASFYDRISLILNPSELFDLTVDRPSDTAVRFAFYYYIENFSKIIEFGNFSYFFRTSLFWLPSPVDFFNLKPDDFEYTMFKEYMQGFSGTMHPTYFGSIFSDAGYLFPVWILITHFFHFFSTRITHLQKSWLFFVLTWAVLAISGVMMARGSLYAPVVTTLFAFLYFSIARYTSNLSWIIRPGRQFDSQNETNPPKYD